MAYYRLYFMSQRTGHIVRVEEIEAVDDAQALALVEDHAGSEPMELWSGNRKVRRFPIRTGFAAAPDGLAA